MKTRWKRLTGIFLCAALIFSNGIPVYAQDAEPEGEIQAVDEVPGMQVSYGTSLEEVQNQLPKTVNVTLKDTTESEPTEVLWKDDFSNPQDSTTKWKLYDPNGVVKFQEGKMTVGASKNLKVLAGEEQYTDFVAETEISGPENPINNFGIMFRCTDVTEHNADSYKGYYAGIGFNAAAKQNSISIGYADGFWHDVKTIPFPYEGGKTYQFKIVAYQNHMTVFVDDQMVYQATDDRYASGSIGLRSYDQAFDTTGFTIRTVTKDDLKDCGIWEGIPAEVSVADWNCTNYDGKNPGKYTFEGTLGENGKITNPENLKATTEVTVKELPQEAGDTEQAVDFTQVHITDKFWAARQKQFICEVIPTGIANVEKATGGIPNIINTAKMHRGEPHGGFQGAFYVDSDVHKVLESMCYALQIDPQGDAQIAAGQAYIKNKLEEWIPYFVDAQEENGYFDTYFTLGGSGNTERWSDFNLHELYLPGIFMKQQ